MDENGLVHIEGREKLTEKEIVEKIILSFNEAKKNFKSLKNTEKLFELEEKGDIKLIPEAIEYIRKILDFITNKDGNKVDSFEEEVGKGLLDIKNIQHLIIGLLNVIRKKSNIDLDEDYKIREENEVITDEDKNYSKYAIYGIFRGLIEYKEEQEKLKENIYDNEFKDYIKKFIISNREKLLNTNFLAICEDESVKKDPDLLKIIGDKKLLQFFLLCLIEDYTKNPYLQEVDNNPIFQNKIEEEQNQTAEEVGSILDQLGNNNGTEAKDLFDEIEGNKVKEKNILNKNEQKLLEGFLILAKNLNIDIEDFRDNENPFVEIAGYITNIFKDFDKIIELEETKVKNLELELKEKKEKIDDYLEKIEKAKKKDIGALKAILKELEIQNIESSTPYTILSEIKKIKNRIIKFAEANKKLNNEKNEIIKNYNILLNRKDKEIERINKEKESFTNEIIIYREKYLKLKKEGKDIENLELIKQLKEELEKINSLNFEVGNINNELKSKIQNQEFKIASQENTIKSKDKELEEKDNELLEAYKNAQEKDKKIKELEEQLKQENQKNEFMARGIRGTYTG